MKLEHKPRPPAEEELAEPEVAFARSPVRCPYCHGSCTADDLEAIVCQQCLSRHHAGCWQEDGKCASCGSKRALAGAKPLIQVSRRELKLVKRGMPRQAVLKVLRRTDVTEQEATRAVLEAASRELERRRTFFGLPPWAIVIMTALLIPILAIIFD